MKKIFYKNPDIFSYELLAGVLYVVVNPLISDGMKVLSQIQKQVLDEVNGNKEILDIAKNLNLEESAISNIIGILEEKDFISEKNSFKVFRENQNPKSINVWVHTTNSCNIACTYCYIHKDNTHMSNEIYDKFYEKIIELVKARGLRKVTLRMAGGEPLTRFSYYKSFLEKLKADLKLLECKLEIAFLTNLTILTDEFIEFVKKHKCGITVSIDGLKEYNDVNRIYANGNGTFDKIEKNLDILKEHKIGVFVNIVIAEQNLAGILDLTKYLVVRGIGFRYSFVNGESLDKIKLSEVLTQCYTYIEENLELYYDFSKRHTLADLSMINPSSQACGAGKNTFVLNTNGNIHYCPMVLSDNKAIAKLSSEEDLLTQISNQKEYSFQNTCFSCPYRYICSGGCPLEVVNGKSPFCDIFQQFIPVLFRLQAKQQILNKFGLEKYKQIFQK